jgi:hypothetical protein
MSAKRISSPGVMIVLLTIAFVGGGCATTSSEVSKPHKPQMITANGAEEVGTSEVSNRFSNGFSLSDGWANFLTAVRPVFEIFGGFANR